MKYKNLVEYLNKKDDCYDALMDAVNKFIYGNKNNLDFSTDLIPNPFGYIKVEDATISSLHTEMLPQNYVLMHCNVYADIAIKGRAYGKWKSDVEEDCKTIWLTLKIKAKFVGVFSEFKIIDVRHIEDKDRYSIKNSANKNFIPYIRTEDLDSYATNFLLHYYPEALKTPMPLPVMKIVEKMGLKVGNINNIKCKFNKGIFGQCYFNDTILKKPNGEKLPISKGTILYDAQACFFRGIGSERNTVIHECVHWELHRKYFALRHLLDNKPSSIHCSVLDSDNICNNQYGEDYNWMEWQANALTPRILMPANTVKLKYDELRKLIFDKGETRTRKIHEIAIPVLAQFFQVTITSAKIRLLELGYDEVKGVYNYVDNHYSPSHVYNRKNPNIKPNQTFSAPLVDSIESVANNEKLRNCLTNGTIVYAEVFFVINNQKYIYKDQTTKKYKLTNYALDHMDECCLVYDNERRAEWGKQCQFDERYYSMCFLNRQSSDQTAYTSSIKDNEHNDVIIEQSFVLSDVIYDARQALDFAKLLTGTFSQNFKFIQENYRKGEKYSNRELASLTGINNHKIGELLQGTKQPTKYEVLAIIAGLCLHPTIGERLLISATYNLVVMDERDSLYKFFMYVYYEEGLEDWNQHLKDLNLYDWQLP